MRKYLKGALFILLIVIAFLHAADFLDQEQEHTDTYYYPDKGNYMYYYSTPETSTQDQSTEGIYFYD